MKIEIEVGPIVGGVFKRLQKTLAPELVRHLLREGVLRAALRYGERLKLDPDVERLAHEEINQQLKDDL